MLALGEALLLALISFAIWWIALRSIAADHEAKREGLRFPVQPGRWDLRSVPKSPRPGDKQRKP
jgi:hypothetical protein